MNFKPPKDDRNFRWTHHVVRKMEYYGLTPARVMRVVRAPERIEDGVAEGTLAGMQTAGTKAKPWEIWAMWKESKPASSQLKTKNYQLTTSPRLIITSWRYPGVSPVRERAPIPSEILAELEAEGVLED